jgi:hypothetical protein
LAKGRGLMPTCSIKRKSINGSSGFRSWSVKTNHVHLLTGEYQPRRFIRARSSRLRLQLKTWCDAADCPSTMKNFMKLEQENAAGELHN